MLLKIKGLIGKIKRILYLTKIKIEHDRKIHNAELKIKQFAKNFKIIKKEDHEDITMRDTMVIK